MIIKSITIKNFQVHKHLHCSFTDGVNVIVGESGKGKSALIRALNWVIHNKPVSAEKIFQKLKVKDTVEVIIEDSCGNVITRGKKLYKLNDIEFKAFNKEVPNDIAKLLPLKNINWHRQHDPHFLILDTHGNAAKVIHKASGMEEQEFIIKEIKNRISDKKGNIKRLTEDIAEQESVIKKLRYITSLHKKAKSIHKKNKILEEEILEAEQLQNILNRVQEIDNHVITTNIDNFLKKIDLLQKKVYEVDIEQEALSVLINLITHIESLQECKIDVTQSIRKLSQFISDFKTLEEEQESISQIQDLIQSINSLDTRIKENEILLEEKQKIFDREFKSLKMCPLCNSKL